MRLSGLFVVLAVLSLGAVAHAEETSGQPSVAHAYYGADGFWHCVDGYLPAEGSGECAPAREVAERGNLYIRLRQYDQAERARMGTASQR